LLKMALNTINHQWLKEHPFIFVTDNILTWNKNVDI
jgi:hypothetical protein